MAKKNIWTGPHSEGGWQNRREGAQRASARYARKSDAEAAGRSAARRDGVEHFIQRRDGTIQNRNSYGNDPFPPRDTKH